VPEVFAHYILLLTIVTFCGAQDALIMKIKLSWKSLVYQRVK